MNRDGGGTGGENRVESPGDAAARSAGEGVVVANRVRRGFYLDSVVLMRISATLSEREGVESASLMIGTPSNLEILAEAGLLTEAGRAAGPDDLVLAVRAAGEETLAAALEAAETSLDGTANGSEGGRGRAVGRLPGVRGGVRGAPRRQPRHRVGPRPVRGARGEAGARGRPPRPPSSATTFRSRRRSRSSGKLARKDGW